MKCCSKAFVGLAVLAGLGVAVIAATGVGPAVWHRVVHKFEKQIPPEIQVEQLKHDISKLDQDIDKNWTLIAKYEHDVKQLEKEIDNKQVAIKTMDKELAAAADELEAKAKFVHYKGRDYSRSEALRKVDSEAAYFASLKREVAVKEKLLGARKEKLATAMAIQDEMKTQKHELTAAVERLQADLEMLNLRRSESKLPTTDRTRLDKIKSRMNKLQEEIEIETRANELRESSNGRANPTPEGKEKVSTDESVLRRVREALGNNSVAKDDE
jgi:chromosome segregation ATPase